MSDPVTFNSATARYALPFLFTGQAQKEIFLNEVAARTDLLLHPAIKGITNSPPASPQPGDCWLVGNAPTAGWTGRNGHLAGFQAGNWLFIAPRSGMTVFNESAGQIMRFANGWHMAAAVPGPQGGTVIDVEARATLDALIAALLAAGLLPNT
ncbi:DUF2793 domain-containing protein [Altererythrobacter lauratis]|uniref:DUF2793 domain-containing protein n=1 Tax=Alteraurantiacibacter lauratis TaxID=2054627 RepID=A0ABV7EI17_9SPHN